ncbi:MAG: TonB-dependent receptor [Ferruginibacter sp.]
MEFLKKMAGVLYFIFLMQVSYGQYQLTGKVVSEKGMLMPGANVTNGDVIFVTDSTGHFAINTSAANEMLTFTYVGYDPFSIRVSKDSSVTITLTRNNNLLEETIVRAFEQDTELKNVSAAVTVLTKASLERYSNTNFVPAFNTVPGVKMDERSPGSYRISIRGNLLRSAFGVRNVKMYWNGIPFTDANGNTYFNQVGFSNIGKVEIIKGPSGSMYGSGTGGVVLLSGLCTKQNEKYFLLQSSVGSYGLFGINGSYNASGEKNSSSASFSHLQSNGYRRHTDLRRDVANYTGSYLINSKQTISTNIFYSDLYYQTPGGLTLAELQADPRQSRPAAGMFKSAETQQAALYLKTFYIGLGHEYNFSREFSNTTSIYNSHTDFKNPTIRNYERKTEQGIGGRTVFQYRKKIISSTLGGEFQYSFNNTATYGNRLGVTDTLQYNDEINSRLFNVFLQNDITIKKFILTAGVSYNNYYYGFLRLNDVGSGKESSDFAPQFVPRFALSYEISNNANFYASVSKGYSPPSIDEVHASDGKFNQQLRAETGWNYEAGIKTNPVKNKLWADVSYYIFSLQNTIVSRRDASGADFYVNAGKTKQRGLEAAINFMPVNNNLRFVEMLKIWSNFTSIKARFDNYQQGAVKFDGNKLTGTPPNVFVLGVDVKAAKHFFGNFSYTYTDRIPLNDANTVFATHYNLLFGKVGYTTDLKKKVVLEMYLSAERSFNEPFSLGNDLNAAGNRFYNPASPDNFAAGIKLRFNCK